ncbi:MAG: HAD family hydrolase [Methanofollis sp.]|jgi:Cu+-exporting ATPase|uniref:HAD family hydrolase n=1 Tax=unclassified Methanofollis TaxID=2634179 RepID=UPI002625EDDD|nr:HAD family hydrolase [Methanofollis sp.]MDD4254564.1 HAD family hydrolase [Methanofollis sp.]
MTVAVVFDSAGTLLRSYRTARDVVTGELLSDVETTVLTCLDRSRVLIALNAHSRDVIAASPDQLLSAYLCDRNIGFGVSCLRQVVPQEHLARILYQDDTAQVEDLQTCIRDVWTILKEESLVVMDSGAILNLSRPGIEFTVTAGGRPFEGAKEAMADLHAMGVATYIASGDRAAKLEKIADHLGIPRDQVHGIATPSIKAQIVADLKQCYDTVVMVGDGINDLQAFSKADIAILSEQQSRQKPKKLCDAADYIIGNVSDVVPIVRDLCGDEIVSI